VLLVDEPIVPETEPDVLKRGLTVDEITEVSVSPTNLAAPVCVT
jgi:hypothetical protein